MKKNIIKLTKILFQNPIESIINTVKNQIIKDKEQQYLIMKT